MSTTLRTPATEADLLAMPADGRKYELVEGEVRVIPAGLRHEQIGARLIARLLAVVGPARLGEVFGSSAGYRLRGGNVRSPDVSFVAADRLPGGRVPEGFGDFAPDLAVEILSPQDEPREVLDKVGEYLQAGVRMVWVVDPAASVATAYRSLASVTPIGLDDELPAGEIVAGFRCTLRSILEG